MSSTEEMVRIGRPPKYDREREKASTLKRENQSVVVGLRDGDKPKGFRDRLYQALRSVRTPKGTRLTLRTHAHGTRITVSLATKSRRRS